MIDASQFLPGFDTMFLLQAFSSGTCLSQHCSRQGKRKRGPVRCEAVTNTGTSARKGNELLFAAVETLFRIPPLFNMAVKQV